VRAADPDTPYNMGESCDIRVPITCTAANGSANIVSVGHGLAPNMPVFFRSAPSNFAVGTRYFVRTVVDPDTFTLASTPGGTAVVAGASGDHELAPELIHVATPSDETSLGKGAMVFAASSDQGQMSPSGYHLVSFGGALQELRVVDAEVALPGDRLELVASSRTVRVNNASTTPYAIVIKGKYTGSAGRVTALVK
jgi:hypothetical protein